MAINKIGVRCFKIPTPTPEKDGTLEWEHTKFVVVEVFNGAESGIGYTYADSACAVFIDEHLSPLLKGKDENENLVLMEDLKRNVRNMGNAGVSSMALAAVDVALWDLKAKRLKVSIQTLLGKRAPRVPFYGSGLFINNTPQELAEQVNEFKKIGVRAFKMKIGEDPDADLERVRKVREEIGQAAKLYVDANGKYEVKQALSLAFELERLGVSWFEEPISSDNIKGLKFLRSRFPETMMLVAGEYCYQVSDFFKLLENQAVDLIQVDATRCEGATGALRACSLAKAFNTPVSTHTAPALHGNLGVCMENFSIGELFYDHNRIEDRYLELAGSWQKGNFAPLKEQTGFGWRLKEKIKEAQIYEQIFE